MWNRHVESKHRAMLEMIPSSCLMASRCPSSLDSGRLRVGVGLPSSCRMASPGLIFPSSEVFVGVGTVSIGGVATPGFGLSSSCSVACRGSSFLFAEICVSVRTMYVATLSVVLSTSRLGSGGFSSIRVHMLASGQ
jgi:hypothetical protein